MVDFDEFIIGLATICRGTNDDKTHFLFDMYDVSDDHTISKDDFGTLLNQIPTYVLHPDMPVGGGGLRRQSSAMAPASSDGHSDDGHSDHGGNETTPPPLTISPNYDEVDSYTNHDIIEKAFQDCDLHGEGRLHFEEFRMWVGRNPAIIEYFDDILPYAGSKKNADTKHHSAEHNKHVLPHHHHHHSGPSSLSRRSTMIKGQWSSSATVDDGGVSVTGTPRLSARVKTFSGTSPDFFTDTPKSSGPPSLSAFGRDAAPSPSGSVKDDGSEQDPGELAAASARPGGGLVRQESQDGHMINAPRYRYNMDSNAASDYNALQGSSPAPMADGDERIYELDGQKVDSELMTYMLLERAAATTKNDELKRVLREVIEHIPGINNMSGLNYNSTTNDLIHVADGDRRISDTSIHSTGTDVVIEGNLWKKGKFLHLWSKRWYILSGNCMYYYDDHNKKDMALRGVVFLTGNLVEEIEDHENELKGYWGFELTHQDIAAGEHHRHEKRVFYCKSQEERATWLSALQHAAEVVPVEDDYCIGKELGKGRFSIVNECVHKRTNKHCAVKVIDKRTIDPEDKGLLRTEIAVLKLVEHPNIIRLEGIYECKNYIYIVMEKLSGGELFERLIGRPRLSEVEAARLLKPLLEAVAYLHELGIAHRDLKPENILCGETLEEVKIADFGLSKMVLPKEKLEGACGTLSYVAPEVLSQQGYGVQADIWSMGVILFLVMCGKLPFDGDDQNEIIRKTVNSEPMVNPTVWNKLSEDARSMIMEMLNKNPKTRITARDTLRHPFIVNNCSNYNVST
jgi:tRNA A-37 threonylcarbamoyl transferase component Bud32/Ca2+-binding EF-hand superfamily protein